MIDNKLMIEIFREQIGTVDLDYVISDCRREGLYEKNLKQYETIALNIIQAVKLK